MSTDLRDRLKACRADLNEARDELKEREKAVESAKEKVASSDVPVAELTESDDFKSAEQAVKERGESKDKINQLEHAEKSLLEMLEGPAAAAPSNGQPDAAKVSGWNPNALLSSEAYQRFIESGIHTSKGRMGAVQLGQIADRESTAKFLSAVIGSDETTGAQPADRRGFIQPNLKSLDLLDLIPSGTTDSTLIEYVQILTIPSSAAEWDEDSVKPESDFTTQDADAPVRTIAGWLKVKKNALSDVPALQTILNTLLPYDVRRRIESQIIAGNGEGDNLRGILNTTGVGEPEAVAGDNQADVLLRAATTVVLSDGEPNFVATHPLTWQDLLLLREDEEARTGAYLYGTPASPASPTIWGMSLVSNRAIPADQPLVGDSNGATLLVKEGVNVRVSDSDQDDFIRNRATILAEARVAFPVWRPTSFAIAPVPGS